MDLDGRVGRIIVSGDLDVYAVPELRACLQGAVGAGAVHLVIDLGGVEMLDSSALGVLVSAQRRVVVLGGSITLEKVAGPARAAFDMTGLAVVFGL